MRIRDFDEPRHLGGFVSAIGFFGKRGRKVVDEGAVFFGLFGELATDRRALPSALGET